MDVFLTLLFTAMAIVALWRHLVTLLAFWRSDRADFMASMKLIAIYAAYCAIGIGVLVSGLNGPQPESRALGGALLLIAWIFYGALWLTRLAPRYTELPRWIERCPGPADAVLGAAGAIGAVIYFG